MLSLLNLYDFISDFGPTVRKEMYDKGLRSQKVFPMAVPISYLRAIARF